MQGGQLPKSIIAILLNRDHLKKITYSAIKNLERRQSLEGGWGGLGDDVQGNFYKLLQNANFGFDCRDNSQNKSLHLIYDDYAKIEFINRYEGYKIGNCFLSLEAKIKNIQAKYNDVENLAFDKQPFAETLKEA